MVVKKAVIARLSEIAIMNVMYQIHKFMFIPELVLQQTCCKPALSD